ncbi:hypothetical protein H257_11251 [Aphanomyces astaci]|uniref:Uncharacterized protein n=1 Tax=Aphanomyces astaci TaxID=112090 RepID=W4G2I3_APHAT|nr:hypothetical protein H257_11251 [Aphanomyces astaci]ETV73927.1 hypothetical protein H257_11251 [Aphanomyces astaci]|eukprot:XP_009836440.1 hypothetical protein H257_11251 [Aphanomyces astaci]
MVASRPIRDIRSSSPVATIAAQYMWVERRRWVLAHTARQAQRSANNYTDNEASPEMAMALTLEADVC